jgi:hypothetical protein
LFENSEFLFFSQLQFKDYEHEYDLIIHQDFDEITYQIDRFLHTQQKSYKKLRKFILVELRLQSSSSSSSEDEEIELPSPSNSENLQNNPLKKRLKTHS